MSDNHHTPYVDGTTEYKADHMNAPLGQLDAAITALSQIVVKDRDLTTPPSSPVSGDTYIPSATATDDWAGMEDYVVYWNGSEWIGTPPQDGWKAWIVDEGIACVYDSGWAEDTPTPGDHTHTESDITDLDKYTQADVDSALAGKSDTTHNHNLADLTEKNYSSLDSPPDDDDMHTLTAETTIADDDEVLIWDTSAGAYRRMTKANLVAVSDPYDIGGTFNGPPTDGFVLLRYPMPRAVTFPAALTLSQMIAGTAATASAEFSMKKNGTEFGTATFAASGTSATFAAASETSFAVGDILTIVAPASADATLADLGWAIVGTR